MPSKKKNSAGTVQVVVDSSNDTSSVPPSSAQPKFDVLAGLTIPPPAARTSPPPCRFTQEFLFSNPNLVINVDKEITINETSGKAKVPFCTTCLKPIGCHAVAPEAPHSRTTGRGPGRPPKEHRPDRPDPQTAAQRGRPQTGTGMVDLSQFNFS